MTEATRITIDNIDRMIAEIAETEYRRGYADALKEKELTEKHWQQADIMDLLHNSWKERIKERENMTEKPEATIETILQLIRNDIDAYLVEQGFGSEYRDEIKAFIKTPWEDKTK